MVVNNQVGFTTSPASSRSSFYCTDVARMIQAPIFHVNGDDPEACVRVARLAFEFRQEFHKDVVIDLVCYRRRGHNEGDDPSMTQPLMYALIDNKRSVRKIYTEALIGRGDITVEEAEEALRDYQGQLERVFSETREADQRRGDRRGHQPARRAEPSVGSPGHRTAVDLEVVKRIADAHVALPDGFTAHPQLMPQLQRRAEMASEGGIDWAMGELLAFGSLLLEGKPVRLAGQDSRRGTFVQRHAVLVDKRTGDEYTPLAHLADGQARFYDLRLAAVASSRRWASSTATRWPARTRWCCGRRSSATSPTARRRSSTSSSRPAEQKWGQRSSVVLLLPHGYEGQGPDHSSARIERFLQMCAEDNMTVAYPTTPASYFHLLRWQALPRAAPAAGRVHAEVDAAAEGGRLAGRGLHRRHLPAGHPRDRGRDRPHRRTPRAALLRQGLLRPAGRARQARNRRRRARRDRPGRAALPARRAARSPRRSRAIREAELVWVQEEPANQGPWPFIALNLPEYLGGRALSCIARNASASPAAGSHKMHDVEQRELVERSFTL